MVILTWIETNEYVEVATQPLKLETKIRRF